MAQKILLTWNIRARSERDQREHFKLVRDFVGKLPTAGLKLEDAWYTAYGNAPQVLLGIVAHDQREQDLRAVLGSEAWEQLISEIKVHIIDYRQRIITLSPGNSQFQV
ncbi:MAG: hypothetical protein JW934_21260 [Anaerolineae bacterium]|nr:hypothetical protein [Anaerolineae bacterium]